MESLLLALSLLAGADDGSAPELAVDPLARVVREEHFLIERPAEAGTRLGLDLPELVWTGPVVRSGGLGEEGRLGRVLGALRVVAARSPGTEELERVAHLFAVRTEVRHVETFGEGGARLVWRELGDVSARTLRVVWDRERGALDLTEWGMREPLRAEIAAPEGAWFPLQLDERIARGWEPSGSVVALDPLERRLARYAVRVHASPEAPGRRLVVWTRADGTEAGRTLFEEGARVAIQWQAGGPIARRIDRERYGEAIAAAEEPGDDDRVE